MDAPDQAAGGAGNVVFDLELVFDREFAATASPPSGFRDGDQLLRDEKTQALCVKKALSGQTGDSSSPCAAYDLDSDSGESTLLDKPVAQSEIRLPPAPVSVIRAVSAPARLERAPRWADLADEETMSIETRDLVHFGWPSTPSQWSVDSDRSGGSLTGSRAAVEVFSACPDPGSCDESDNSIIGTFLARTCPDVPPHGAADVGLCDVRSGTGGGCVDNDAHDSAGEGGDGESLHVVGECGHVDPDNGDDGAADSLVSGSRHCTDGSCETDTVHLESFEGGFGGGKGVVTLAACGMSFQDMQHQLHNSIDSGKGDVTQAACGMFRRDMQHLLHTTPALSADLEVSTAAPSMTRVSGPRSVEGATHSCIGRGKGKCVLTEAVVPSRSWSSCSLSPMGIGRGGSGLFEWPVLSKKKRRKKRKKERNPGSSFTPLPVRVDDGQSRTAYDDVQVLVDGGMTPDEFAAEVAIEGGMTPDEFVAAFVQRAERLGVEGSRSTTINSGEG